MLKFPTLLFLFLKIGNPGSGWLPVDLEHFSLGQHRLRCSQTHTSETLRPVATTTAATVCIHRTSNSRKWSFPHRASDIKLLTVAIWRGGMEWFHFTVQILSRALFARVWPGNQEPWPLTADCLPFAHNPRTSARYCFIASNLVDLMACWQICLFLRFMFLDYLLRFFVCNVGRAGTVSGFTIWRNGYMDALFRLFCRFSCRIFYVLFTVGSTRSVWEYRCSFFV